MTSLLGVHEALSGRSTKGQRSVDRPLEDEPHMVVASAELLCAEGACGVEGVCAVWKWDLTPESSSLLRAHMTAWTEGVSGRSCINVKPCFTAQPQWHIGAACAAHWALALGPAACSTPFTPVVVPMHMAALQVRPGLLLSHGALAPAHARECQCVEAHRTLWPCRIQLLPQRVQVFKSGSTAETLSSAPQQRSTTQVDQSTIRQLLCLTLHLWEERIEVNVPEHYYHHRSK